MNSRKDTPNNNELNANPQPLKKIDRGAGLFLPSTAHHLASNSPMIGLTPQTAFGTIQDSKTGVDALTRFCKSTGLEPGQQILLVYGDHNQRTMLATIAADGISGIEVSVSNECQPSSWSKAYGYQGLRGLAKGLNLFWLPSKANRGRKLEHIDQPSDLIYAEIDDLSPDEQWAKWQAFFERSGLTPAAIVWTGGKSYHVYFRVSDGFTSLEAWGEAQQMLCATMASDPALTSPHQPMRLPGFPRIKNGEQREVSLIHSSEQTYAVAELIAGFQKAWDYPQAFSSRRWGKYRNAVAILNNPTRDNAGILPMARAEDAFVLSETELFPKVESVYKTPDERRATNDANPWVRLLENEITPALERMPLDQQFAIAGFDNRFKRVGSQLVGCSPWSATNGSGTALKVNIREGSWSCHASQQGSQSVRQYLQLVWYGKTGRAVSGRDFIEFCTRLAAAVGVTVPDSSVESEAVVAKVEAEAETGKATKTKPKRGKTEAQKAGYAKKKKKEEDSKWLQSVSPLVSAALGDDVDAAKTILESELRAKQQFNQDHAETGWCPELKLARRGERVLYALDAQKMTGKTSNSIASAVNEVIQRGEFAVVLEPLKTLCKSTAETLIKETGHYGGEILTQPQYTAYEELARKGAKKAKDIMAKVRVVIVCPESMHLFHDKRIGTVILDEANDVILRTLQGNLGNQPRVNRKVLANKLEQAHTVIAATDQMYVPTIRNIQRCGKFGEGETRLIQRKREKRDAVIKLYTDKNIATAGEAWDGTEESVKGYNVAFAQFMANLEDCLNRGQKVVIPCNSQRKARKISKHLASRFPHLKGRIIDGQYTPQETKEQFIANADAWLASRNLDWFIYTPVLNSGVSIEGLHFDAQFELIGPHETATSASQRGERTRDVLNRVRIKERHVYLGSNGIASKPPAEVLTAEYWQEAMENDARLYGEAAELAKKAGLEDETSREVRARQTDLEDCQELPALLAIQAREIYLKEEVLRAEWEGNGWTVEDQLCELSPEVAEMGAELQAAGTLVEMQSSRIISMASTFTKKIGPSGEEIVEKKIVEPGNHKTAEDLFVARKLIQERNFGEDFKELNNPYWQSAWETSASARGYVESLQTQKLFELAVEGSAIWKNARQMFAAISLVGAMENASCETPELPITRKIVEKVALLLQCPFLDELIRDKTTRYSKMTTGVVVAARWAREHSTELKQLARQQGRLKGFQFTESTPDVTCLHRLLKMLGLEGHSVERSKGRFSHHIYQIKTIEQKEAEMELLRGLQESQELGSSRKNSRKDGKKSLNCPRLSRIISPAAATASPEMAEKREKQLEALRNWRKASDIYRAVSTDATRSAINRQMGRAFSDTRMGEFLETLKGAENAVELALKNTLIKQVLQHGLELGQDWSKSLIELWNERVGGCKTRAEVEELAAEFEELNKKQKLGGDSGIREPEKPPETHSQTTLKLA